MAGYASYLRVYEPLSSFPTDERRRWEIYLTTIGAPDRVPGMRLEHRSAAVAAVAGRTPTAVDHAFVHRYDGATYLCPWRTEVRAWQAMADFRRSLPDEIVDAFFPRTTADAAERDLSRWRSNRPDLKSHIQAETWQVPAHWFLLFEGEERRLALRGERSVSYLATMANARRRLARALAVLRRTIDDSPVLASVEDLGRWLENYHHRSLVELDYGGLVSLFEDDDLSADESVADIAHAVGCLAAGEMGEAMRAYRRIVTRWGALRAVEVSN